MYFRPLTNHCTGAFPFSCVNYTSVRDFALTFGTATFLSSRLCSFSATRCIALATRPRCCLRVPERSTYRGSRSMLAQQGGVTRAFEGGGGETGKLQARCDLLHGYYTYDSCWPARVSASSAVADRCVLGPYKLDRQCIKEATECSRCDALSSR